MVARDSWIAKADFIIDKMLWKVSHGDERLADKLKDAFVYNHVKVGFVVKACMQTAAKH